MYGQNQPRSQKYLYKKVKYFNNLTFALSCFPDVV